VVNTERIIVGVHGDFQILFPYVLTFRNAIFSRHVLNTLKLKSAYIIKSENTLIENTFIENTLIYSPNPLISGTKGSNEF